MRKETSLAGEYGDRIARGAALLDEKRPGWRSWINVDTLDVASNHDCVLGQLAGVDGFYCNVVDELFGRTLADTFEQEREHGFEFARHGEEDPEQLTSEWQQYIEATR